MLLMKSQDVIKIKKTLFVCLKKDKWLLLKITQFILFSLSARIISRICSDTDQYNRFHLIITFFDIPETCNCCINNVGQWVLTLLPSVIADVLVSKHSIYHAFICIKCQHRFGICLNVVCINGIATTSYNCLTPNTKLE